MLKQLNTHWLTILGTLLFGLLVVHIFSRFVPYNMDEFSMYHALLCYYYPGNAINVFREGCQLYHLNFLNSGLILPLRVYSYMGSFPGIYYYPLFLLWKSPESARFLGYVFLVVQAGIFYRLAGIKWWHALAVTLLFVPYFFQHIVDTGTVGFQVTATLGICLFLQQWMQTGQHRYPLLIAITAFLAFWTKVVFAWMCPALALLYCSYFIQNKSRIGTTIQRKKLVMQTVGCVLLTMSLVSCLLLSTHPLDSSHLPMWTAISERGGAYSFSELWQNFWNISAVHSLINPFEATERIFEVRIGSWLGSLYSLLLMLLLPALMALGMVDKQTRQNMIWPIAYYLCFAVTFFMVLRTEKSFRMHHVVLSYPFFLCSAFLLWQGLKQAGAQVLQKVYAVGIVTFLVINILVLWQAFQQPLRYYTGGSAKQVHRILQDTKLAQSYFYVPVDWGMYYYQGLYGPREQSVLYMQPLDSIAEVRSLQSLSKKHNRKLLFVHWKDSSSDLELIQRNFNLVRCSPVHKDANWQILLESSDTMGACK